MYSVLVLDSSWISPHQAFNVQMPSMPKVVHPLGALQISFLGDTWLFRIVLPYYKVPSPFCRHECLRHIFNEPRYWLGHLIVMMPAGAKGALRVEVAKQAPAKSRELEIFTCKGFLWVPWSNKIQVYIIYIGHRYNKVERPRVLEVSACISMMPCRTGEHHQLHKSRLFVEILCQDGEISTSVFSFSFAELHFNQVRGKICQHVVNSCLIFQISFNFASPPAWMSRYAPFLSVAMTEHSMCHPEINQSQGFPGCHHVTRQLSTNKWHRVAWSAWSPLTWPSWLTWFGFPWSCKRSTGRQGPPGPPGDLASLSAVSVAQDLPECEVIGTSLLIICRQSAFTLLHLLRTGCKRMVLVWSWFEGQGFLFTWSNYAFYISNFYGIYGSPSAFQSPPRVFTSLLGCRMEVRHEFPGGEWMLSQHPRCNRTFPPRLPCL